MIAFLSLLSSAHAEFNQLHAAKAESSSFLKSSWNRYNENYHPNYVLDNNPATAWVEGEDGNGEGSSIRIPISAIRQVENIRLKIRNGYQKSKNLLKANSAPKEIVVRLLNRTGTVVSSKEHTLNREQGWQEIELNIGDSTALINTVELVIKSVHEGYKYKDTCISDIEIWAKTNTAYKSDVELHKQKELMSWVTERKEEAKYFANLPSDYPFIDTQFRIKEGSITKEEILIEAEQSKKLLDSFSGSYFSRENKNKLDSLPDPLDSLPTDIWRLSDLALFEVDKEIAKKDQRMENIYDDVFEPVMEYRQSNFKKKQRSDGSVSHLMYTEYEKWCERTCSVVESSIVASYNSKGLLVGLVELSSVEDEECDGSMSRYEMWSFKYTDTQVSELTRSRHTKEECLYGGEEKEIFEQTVQQIYTPSKSQ
ncbi:MAG: hypothetical protein CMK59_00450 [Proteobacteria bacterium]|nr:hypothetical protein [Pseudomonadota bacterium]